MSLTARNTLILERLGMLRIDHTLARIFGTYQVFKNEHIDGEVRGWIWRDWLYLDLRQK